MAEREAKDPSTAKANKARREKLKKSGHTSVSAGMASRSKELRGEEPKRPKKAAAANESMQNSDVYFHLGQIFLEGSKSSKRLKRITRASEKAGANPSRAHSDKKASELHNKEKWNNRRNIRRPEVDNTDRRHSWTLDQVIAGNAARTPRDRPGSATSKKAFTRGASRTAADSKPVLTTSDRLARKRGKKRGDSPSDSLEWLAKNSQNKDARKGDK
jgi:hypothetical protein